MKERDLLDGRLKLRHLVLLSKIAESGSLAKAAEELNMTQPVLTRVLKDVESVLGFRLFERSTHGVEANAFGEAFLADTRTVLATLRVAGERLVQLATAETGTVTVGNHVAGSSVLLPNAIARLKAESPGIAVIVSDGTPDVLLVELLAGRVDLVVGRLTPEIDHSRFAQRALYREPVRLVARVDHPAHRLPRPDLAALAEYPWILPVARTSLRHEIEGVFQRANVPLPANRVECTSLPVVYSLLAQTDMITPLPVPVGSMDRRLSALPVDLDAIGAIVGVTLAAGREHTPATGALLRQLELVAGAMVG